MEERKVIYREMGRSKGGSYNVYKQYIFSVDGVESGKNRFGIIRSRIHIGTIKFNAQQFDYRIEPISRGWCIGPDIGQGIVWGGGSPNRTVSIT